VAGDLAHSLKASLLSGKSEDCEEFVRLAQPIVALAIARALARWGRPARDRVDDLVQDTFARLYDRNAKALRSFHSDESNALAAWLRAVAGSVTLDSLRSTSAKRRGAGQPTHSLDEPGLALPAPDNTFDSVARSLSTARINDCLRGEKERDRSIFWLYYRHGYTANDIAGLQGPGIGPKGVETAIYRVTKAVRECLGRQRPEGNRQ